VRRAFLLPLTLAMLALGACRSAAPPAETKSAYPTFSMRCNVCQGVTVWEMREDYFLYLGSLTAWPEA